MTTKVKLNTMIARFYLLKEGLCTCLEREPTGARSSLVLIATTREQPLWIVIVNY